MDCYLRGCPDFICSDVSSGAATEKASTQAHRRQSRILGPPNTNHPSDYRARTAPIPTEPLIKPLTNSPVSGKITAITRSGTIGSGRSTTKRTSTKHRQRWHCGQSARGDAPQSQFSGSIRCYTSANREWMFPSGSAKKPAYCPHARSAGRPVGVAPAARSSP